MATTSNAAARPLRQANCASYSCAVPYNNAIRLPRYMRDFQTHHLAAPKSAEIADLQQRIANQVSG